jgi:Fe-S cluster biogenesis protein NfuA
MTIYTEVTPNPSSLKFVVDRTILANGTADFPDKAAAETSVMARTLFLYPFVQGVFIGRNFVTITKTDGARWEDIIPVAKDEIKRVLNEHPVIVETSDVVVSASADAGDEVVNKIKQLIDEQVRPAVAMDGGDIIYQGFEDGVVRLQLRGSCSGCPSSMMTLKAGIQGLLTRMVPEVKAVEAI